MTTPQLGPFARLGYFVLQARVTRKAEELHVTGVLENLSSGEKQSFEGCDGLARLLELWSRVK